MSKLVERCAGLRMTISGPPVAAGRNGKPWKKRSATPRRGAALGRENRARPIERAFAPCPQRR